MKPGTIEAKLKIKIIDNLSHEGKNSSVFIGYDPQLDTQYVVKAVDKTDFRKVEDYYEEAKILYASEHPNIVKIQYACETEDCILFTMPLHSKGSVNRLIEDSSYTCRSIIKLSIEFLTGLHYIHTKKLIHFDIKPSNILISNSGRALLSDFGLTKYADRYGFARPNKVYHSHMPPEYYMAAELTNLSDIYQAGLTIYRLCNGNADYNKQFGQFKDAVQFDSALQNGEFPKRKYLPHIPKKMQRAINKAIAPNPDNRYQSVMDLMNDLSRIDSGLDWTFNANPADCHCCWETNNTNSTHTLRLCLIKSKSEYNLMGFKLRKRDGKSFRINHWTTPSFTTKDDVLKKCSELIAEHNE